MKLKTRLKCALRKARDGAMSVKEFAVFAVTVFFGLLIGGWIVQIIGIASEDLLGQMLAFLIPTLVVYVGWKKLGATLVK